MGDHLLFSEHLTAAPCDAKIRDTYLGQAHIAGTGPEGATCRECVFWRLIGWRKEGGNWREYVKPHAYHGKRHTATPGALKKHKCTRPIMNKANRLIPHDALACRLFEANERPPEAKKADPVAA